MKNVYEMADNCHSVGQCFPDPTMNGKFLIFASIKYKIVIIMKEKKIILVILLQTCTDNGMKWMKKKKCEQKKCSRENHFVENEMYYQKKFINENVLKRFICRDKIKLQPIICQ
jgi:hypothetical protein